MKIVFYCNFVLVGWSGADYDKGRSGASEELLTQLSRRLVKDGHDVTIYKNGASGVFDGVKHCEFEDFKPFLPIDVFVSFKNKSSLLETVNAKKKIHWSAEIEDYKPFIDHCDDFISMSNYHKRNCGDIGKTIYNFIDFKETDSFKVDKEEGTALYSSSYDRGLEDILMNWDVIRKSLGLRKLRVIYGWRILNEIAKSNSNVLVWRDKMQKLLKQDGIEELGEVSKKDMIELYWKSEYWLHPVNNPQSELFCVNAVRAQYSGCIPVVRRVGALQETVNEFMDYDHLLGQKVGRDALSKDWKKNNRKYVEQFNFDNIYKQWNELLSN